jgi:GT2 family glycosyltransferase
MAQPPSVTVIIVNWNGRAHLLRCLQALQQQTLANFEAIVVDNGSTDGSPAIVAQLQDPRFQLLSLPSNQGFARANNLGVAQARAESWVALLNPDAFPAPNWLETMLHAAHTQPNVAALGCGLVNAQDTTLWDGTGDSYHLSGRAFRRDHGRPREQYPRVTEDIFAPCAAAALYSKPAWQTVGGLDEDFFCYMEDVDLAFRLRLQGYRCLHVATAECLHVGSGITGRHSHFSGYHGQRNLVWAFVKNMPPPLFVCLLPLHILANLAAMVLYAWRGQWRTVWQAKRDAVAQLPLMWRKRQAIQAARRVRWPSIWAVLNKQLWPHP